MAIISNFPGGADSAAVVVSATAPSDTTKLWRSTVDGKLRYFNGTSWEEAGGGAELTSDDYLTAAEIDEIVGTDVYWDGTVE